MKCYASWRLIVVLLFGFWLNACGGGGDGLSAGGGIGGTGIISTGAVASFGSIVVNGTTFDTSNARLIVDGEELGVGDGVVQANLDIGKIVTVEGPGKADFNRAVAGRVTYNNNVEGPVEGIRHIDSTTKEIVVMGQTVVVNALTQFKGTTLDTLTRNDLVEISGLFDNRGTIWATFVEKTGAFSPMTIVEVSGFVKNQDAGNRTFKVNNLTVDYSLADTTELPEGVPTEGLQIEAEGRLDSVGNILFASKIEIGDDLESEDADEIEIIGFVTKLESITAFTLGNQAVVIEDGAEIVDGELAEITLGVKLEVEGTLINDVLFAYEVEFWEPDQIEVEDIVTDIASSSEFTIGNQVVVTDEDTVFEDIDPEEIVLGMTIEVKGRPRGGVLVADKVSFEIE